MARSRRHGVGAGLADSRRVLRRRARRERVRVFDRERRRGRELRDAAARCRTHRRSGRAAPAGPEARSPPLQARRAVRALRIRAAKRDPRNVRRDPEVGERRSGGQRARRRRCGDARDPRPGRDRTGGSDRAAAPGGRSRVAQDGGSQSTGRRRSARGTGEGDDGRRRRLPDRVRAGAAVSSRGGALLVRRFGPLRARAGGVVLARRAERPWRRRRGAWRRPLRPRPEKRGLRRGRAEPRDFARTGTASSVRTERARASTAAPAPLAGFGRGAFR